MTPTDPSPSEADRAPDATVAWLIERGQPEGQSPPCWWVGEGHGKYGPWTFNAVLATRYHSRDAAQKVLDESYAGHGPRSTDAATAHVCEHIFLSRADAPLPAVVPGVWTPDQPLRADASPVQMRDRLLWVDRNIKFPPTYEAAYVYFVITEFAAAVRAVPVAPSPQAWAGNLTRSEPLNAYGVRHCRGHWHVTRGGEDIMCQEEPGVTDGDRFADVNAALDAADKLNAATAPAPSRAAIEALERYDCYVDEHADFAYMAEHRKGDWIRLADVLAKYDAPLKDQEPTP